MKKSKIIFGIIAGLVIGLCILCFILFGEAEQPPADSSTTPEPTIGNIEVNIPEDVEQEVLDVTPTDPQVEVGSNVRIQQVEKDPNEIIDRTPTTDPNHPEVLQIEATSPMMSAEGSVYRNDKIISIDITDQQTGEICTFSFGYITGGCNRFLYLNPQFELNGEKIENNIYFKFDQPYGGGTVETHGIDPQENIDNELLLNYAFYRALEEKQVAGYTDGKHPGTFWFTPTPVDNNIYIDVRAYYYQGGLFATLRLTLEKGADGTYAIADLDNKDLLTNGDNSRYSLDELKYIVKLTDDTYHTPGAVHSYNSAQLDWVLKPEDCLIELRDATTGLYFNQFIPSSGSSWTKDYTDSQIPILACTYRWKGQAAQTMYFWVMQEPTKAAHGDYQYIGYDYPLIQTVALLEGYGYEGNG